jgi:hypothetical protein
MLTAALLAGCAARTATSTPAGRDIAEPNDGPMAGGRAVAQTAKAGELALASSAPATPRPVAEGAAPDVPAGLPTRRIIRDARAEMVCERLGDFQKRLDQLLRESGAFIVESSISGSTGEPRDASWTIRVPSRHFDQAMGALERLGEVVSLSTSGQDVTEEYYDIEARLKNKRVEEERLIGHLRQSTARLTDILEVEREISRVRGEIEQMEGRRRLLATLSDLATVRIHVRERRDYVPPTPPSFVGQIGKTFRGSLAGVAHAAEGAVLFVVALVPWAAVAALLVSGGLLLWKRRIVALAREKPSAP